MPIQIKCHGEFYSRDGQLKLTIPFVEIVKAPSLKFFEQTNTRYTGTDDNGQLQFKDTTFLNVRGVLKKKLLPLILQNKHQGRFVRVRKVMIDEVTAASADETKDLPINLMSISQLSHLIKQRNIPLDPNSYVTVDELRTDITEYQDDPDVFQRNYAHKSAKRRSEREFMELNNLLPSTPSLPQPEAPQPQGKAKRGIGAVSQAQTENNPF
jgi:hypothetical protein